MAGESRGLIFPRLPMLDVGAWAAVAGLVAVPTLILVNGRLSLAEQVLWLAFFVGPLVLLVMIFNRGRRARRGRPAIEAAPGRRATLVFFDGQEVSSDGRFLPAWGEGCVAFDDEGVSIWRPLSNDWAGEVPDVHEPSTNVRLIRSERLLKHVCYPCLLVDLEDGRRLRFIPLKQHGAQWRAGMTRREMRDMLVRISEVFDGKMVNVDGDERYQK